jgi:hypothetical protein
MRRVRATTAIKARSGDWVLEGGWGKPIERSDYDAGYVTLTLSDGSTRSFHRNDRIVLSQPDSPVNSGERVRA